MKGRVWGLELTSAAAKGHSGKTHSRCEEDAGATGRLVIRI